MSESESLNVVLQIGIVGGFVSLLMQLIKAKYGPTSITSKFIVVALSLIFGAGYVFLKDTSYWPTVLLILLSSSTIYAFFINK